MIKLLQLFPILLKDICIHCKNEKNLFLLIAILLKYCGFSKETTEVRSDIPSIYRACCAAGVVYYMYEQIVHVSLSDMCDLMTKSEVKAFQCSWSLLFFHIEADLFPHGKLICYHGGN